MPFARLFAIMILAVLSASAPAAWLLAQQKPPQPPPAKAPAQTRAEREDPQYRIRVRSELVVVPVTVKDGAGLLVTDLRQDEFRIFEDDVEQSVDVYSAESFPISAIVLLDNDLPTKASDNLQKSAPAIAGSFSELDEAGLLLFDEFPRTVLDITKDNDKLYDHLKRLKVSASFPGIGSGPMTAGPRVNQTSPEAKVTTRTSTRGQSAKNLDDAIFAAAKLLRDRGRDRRKIIFLVSDGVNSGNNEVSRDDALKLLLSSDISVYAIGLGQAPLNRALNPLAKYAHATGGDVFYANSRDDLEKLFPRVTEQARNQYTLAYTPRGTDRTKEYHLLEVRVRRLNLTILTRDGYYAAPTP